MPPLHMLHAGKVKTPLQVRASSNLGFEQSESIFRAIGSANSYFIWDGVVLLTQVSEWALRDSNPRPAECKSAALTN